MKYAGVAGIAAMALVLAGCGGSTAEKASTEGVEKLVEANLKAHGMNADVEIDDGGKTMSMTANTEAGQAGFTAGEDVGMPADFPQDIPVPGDIKISLVNSMAEQSMYNIMGAVGMSMDELAKYYAENAPAQGWTEVSSTQVPGTMASMQYEKGDRMLRIVAQHTADGTMLTLNTATQ